MSEDPKKAPTAPAAPKAPKAPTPPKPAAAPPKTPAGLAALEQHRLKATDWDAIAAAALKVTGLEEELKKLRARHQRLVDAGHQACDNISALFAALAQERPDGGEL